MVRYFGVKVIPFFPCSYDCKDALEVAKVWQKVMETLDEDATKTALDMLNQPLTWSMYKQIIYINTPLYRGIVNGYECERPKTVVWNENSSPSYQDLHALEKEVTVH